MEEAMKSSSYATALLTVTALSIMSVQSRAQLCNLNDDPVRCYQRYEAEVQKLGARLKSAEAQLGQLRARVDLAKAAAEYANETIARPIALSPGGTITTDVPESGDALVKCSQGMAIIQIRPDSLQRRDGFWPDVMNGTGRTS
jgi:hypothetical protein